MKENKRVGITARSAVLILVATLLAAVNILLVFVPDKYRQIDVGMTDVYKISEESQTFLAGLDDEIEVFVICGQNVDTQFETFMERYCDASDKISLYFISENDAAQVLAKYGYSLSQSGTYSVLVAGKMRQRMVDYYAMFYYVNSNIGTMSYSEYAQLYAYYSYYEGYEQYLSELVYNTKRYFSGDAIITGLVEYVSLDVVPSTYMLTSHGEDSAKDGNLATILKNIGYTYKTLERADTIPSDAGCIVINSPTQDISEREKDSLLDYLARGGRLLLVTDEEAIEFPNLMSLAEYYGAVGKGGIILEDKAASEDAETEENEHSVITPTVNADSDIFATFPEYEIRYKNAHEIIIGKELRPSQIVTPLLSSSETSYVSGEDGKRARTIAVSVEEETPDGTTRMVWFSGSDSFVGEDAYSNNLSLLVWTLGWLEQSYESSIGEIAAVEYGDSLLSVSEEALWCFGAILVSLPILVALLGAYNIKKRKMR